MILALSCSKRNTPEVKKNRQGLAMATKQVATKAGGLLSAAGKPKVFTDAKGRQFWVLKKTLQTPDFYLWRPKNLSAVKGTPTLTSMLRSRPYKDYMFGTRNRFFFRFSTFWMVWIILLFSYQPFVELRDKFKVSELPVPVAGFHHPLSWDMVKEKEKELKVLEGSRYRI
ncbi:uncharacterized protein LOC111128719 isoform X1 [Crassostrea virginica]